MRCANPDCHHKAQDLCDGTLRLIELEVPPGERLLRVDGGFPVCSVPSKYFWLCADCSRILRITRWTMEGLILEYKQPEIVPRPQIRSIRRPPAVAAKSGSLQNMLVKSA